MITTRLKVAFLAAAISLAGCGGQGPTRESKPITLGDADAGARLDYSGLAAVLKAAIGPNGKLLPRELLDNDKMLEGQLMLMAVAGPKTRPDRFAGEHSKLNYWYNARAAWSLMLTLTFSREQLEAEASKASEEKPPPVDRWKMTDDGVSIAEFANRPFPIDGRSMTLALIDSLIVEEFGFKAAIGAPGVSPRRAAIPAEPFNAPDPAKLIDERFNDFLDDESRFAIDAESRRILVPPVLWRFGDRLTTDHRQKYGSVGANLTTALLPHTRLSAHRRLQDAVGYECVEAPDPKVPLIVRRDED